MGGVALGQVLRTFPETPRALTAHLQTFNDLSYC